MEYKEIRVSDIPCLGFLMKSEACVYVGPRLSLRERRGLRKSGPGGEVIYLYDWLDGITASQLSYNFPGVPFPDGFSAETIFDSVREAIKEETGIEIEPKCRFFVRWDEDQEEFVAFGEIEEIERALEGSLLECSIRFRVRACVVDEDRQEPGVFIEAADTSETDDVPEPEDVKKAIEKLLLTGFPVEVIKSWLEGRVRLSRLRVTRQFKILLVDYGKEVKMRPLPKTIFLFYLCHPEGVKFSYLQDYVDELRHIYGRLSRNDDPEKMEQSIASLVDPSKNSISEKVNAVKSAFLLEVAEDVAAHYFIKGAQGHKKGIDLDRSLVEWECEL